MAWRAEPVTEFPGRPSSERFLLLDWLASFALFPRLDLGFGYRSAVSEAERFIARLNDMAVMRQPVQKRGRHLGVAKYARPLGKGLVRCNHHARMLVELR